MTTLTSDAGTKQCTDPHTRARVREFALVKAAKKNRETGVKRRRGEDSAPVSVQSLVAGQRHKIYKAVLECEGMELRAKVIKSCFLGQLCVE